MCSIWVPSSSFTPSQGSRKPWGKQEDVNKSTSLKKCVHLPPFLTSMVGWEGISALGGFCRVALVALEAESWGGVEREREREIIKNAAPLTDSVIPDTTSSIRTYICKCVQCIEEIIVRPDGTCKLTSVTTPALNMQWNMSLESRINGTFCYACKFNSPVGVVKNMWCGEYLFRRRRRGGGRRGG